MDKWIHQVVTTIHDHDHTHGIEKTVKLKIETIYPMG